MTNHNKIAADEFCNKTHTSPIEAYVANRIYELETQVSEVGNAIMDTINKNKGA